MVMPHEPSLVHSYRAFSTREGLIETSSYCPAYGSRAFLLQTSRANSLFKHH